MSIEAQQAMRKHSRAKGSARSVGMALAFYAQKGTFLAWPSNRELAEYVGLEERQVQRLLQVLVDLGEVRRRPDLESYARRRVFLVCPEQGVQLSLLETASEDLQTPPAGCHRRRVSPVTPVMDVELGDTHARAGKEPTEPTLTATPPSPPMGGVDGRVLTRVGSRRRSRRRSRSEPVVAGGCPLEASPIATREVRDALAIAWSDLIGRVRTEPGASDVEMWLKDAHLHRADDVLEIGLGSHVIAWVPQRWGHLLEQLAGRPITYVACIAAERT